MLRYMKIPHDIKHKQKEILKAFGVIAFSPRCADRIEGVSSPYDTEYFYNNDPSNYYYVWGASEEELQDLLQDEDDAIELFRTYRIKYTNKLGSPTSS